ncbi:MAG TPA: hypothetical protein VJT33_13095 [bacterium]|nr:hypothetical protein [bacterium]
MLSSPATYLHFSIFLISVPNLVVIAAMVVAFILAIALPFPRARGGKERLDL